MKLLSTLSIAASLTLAAGIANAGGGHGGDLIIMNDSKDAVAVGGEMIAGSSSESIFSSSDSFLYASGKRANAGSVVVNGCPCRKDTIILNKSRGALAVGAANAGSVVLNEGFGL